ncbi:FAD-binding oxidoreductase [Leifsonia sp. NPDC056824]|uniref:FAD-binding oxidoreductase n=1 Tax=Leifsonia sp. NPDC056824 TaxID=3345953 RepID=UPI0036C3DF8D
MSLTETAVSDRFRDLAARLTGRVVTPADPDWDLERQGWNLAADQRPEAVVVAADAPDIAAVVGFARDHGLRVVPQGTGHLAAPLGDLAGSILLRTSRLCEVNVDVAGATVRVGAGVLWGEVTAALAPHGLAALAGSSPDVGVAGYLLGGGYSWMARERGLGCSAVTAIDVVTADGRQRHVTAATEPDLFWALRGGGGNVAVVTALTFTVFPVATVYAGMLLYPIARAGEVLRAYEEWTRDLTETATTCVRLLHVPPLPDLPDFLRGQAFVGVDGAIDLPEDEAAAVLEPLRALGPAIDTFGVLPAAQLGLVHLDPPQPVPAIGDGLILDDLPEAAIEALVAIAGPEADTALLAIDLRHLGGAAGRPAENGGAVDHFPGRFLAYAVGMLPDPALAPVLVSQVAAMRAALEPWTNPRDYSNFREVPASPSRFYDAATLERLRAIKQAFDPERVIRTAHPLD